MTSRLTHADIGAWLFKCNPREWDIESALRDGKSIDSWRVYDTYRIELIESGDPAVVWVTGARRAKPTPGVWLVGYTTGQIFDDQGDDYWLNRERQMRPSPYAGLRMTALEAPVPREAIVGDPRMADLEVLRQPQMSNPSHLTPEQKDALEQMIGGWPSWG